MRRIFTFCMAMSMLVGVQARPNPQPASGYPITPVPFTSVKVTDSFWGQRLTASRQVTIPLAFSKCEETGRYRNFENAAAHLRDASRVFKVNGVG